MYLPCAVLRCVVLCCQARCRCRLLLPLLPMTRTSTRSPSAPMTPCWPLPARTKPSSCGLCPAWCRCVWGPRAFFAYGIAAAAAESGRMSDSPRCHVLLLHSVAPVFYGGCSCVLLRRQSAVNLCVCVLMQVATLRGHKRGVWDIAFSPSEQVGGSEGSRGGRAGVCLKVSGRVRCISDSQSLTHTRMQARTSAA